MPGIMTYIRQGDYDKYIAIQSKGKGAWTEFIHNALQGQVESHDIEEPLKQTTYSESIKDTRPITDFGSICKNGHSIPAGKSKCLGKSCEYS